jgi:hypothetical protein
MNTLNYYFQQKFHKMNKEKFWGMCERVNLSVVGLGSGLTNIPKGTVGKVVELNQGNYVVKWAGDKLDNFVIFGGMSMDLGILE